MDTIVKRRLLPHGAGFGDFTVDDIALLTGRLTNGALASFKATRFATRSQERSDHRGLGRRGCPRIDLEDLNSLQFYDRTAPPDRQGYTRVLVTETGHPYVAGWWPAGHVLGYEHGFSRQAVDFIVAIANVVDPHLGFDDGLAVQRVLEAVERSSVANAAWTTVHPFNADA